MKSRGFILTSLVVTTAAGALGIGGYQWSIAHVRRWTGMDHLGFVNCNHCHLVSIEELPWAKARPRHPAPAGLAVSPDGERLYIALDDVNEVVEADATSRAVKRKVTLSGAPYGVVVHPDGGRLFVTLRDGDAVVELDATSLRETARVTVGSGPVSLAYSRTDAGERLVVANSLSDDASVLSLSPLKEIARPHTGREPFGVTIVGDRKQAFLVGRLAEAIDFVTPPTSELTLINPETGRLVKRVSLESAHLSEGIASVPSRGWTLTPIVKVRNLVPITQVANGWVMSSGLAVSEPDGRTVQVPLDEANDYFADPSGIAVDAAGERAYVVSGGSDAVSVVDLGRLGAWLSKTSDLARREAIEDLTLSAEYVIARIRTGRNPRTVALSPDGRQLFVGERLEDRVLVVDTTTLQPTGHIVLGDGGAWDPIRRGERVFTRAAHTFQNQFSCRSCHPDAHVDGLAYDFDGDGIGDNLLDNRTLQGVARTSPFKWNGKNPSLQIQCGPRFARVLMRTDPIPAAGLNDLTTYLEAQPPPRWERRRDLALTPTQERGRRLFFATQRTDGAPIPRERQCQTCHRPPLFTARIPTAVGSKGPRDLTDVFDTPHLLGIGYSAPYLHDGRAKTLEELWTTYQTNDLHGVSSYWSKHQLNDLIEYLKTL
ncbi:MAG: hypothetical protein MUF25_22240 [Pirellulaceae bacterium]|nr:hypothetical protein [Pirellulaceae bacterium]